MQLLITTLVAVDLEEVGDYIAQDNPIRAGTFVAELRAHRQKISLNPARIRRRPELSDDLRSCVHARMATTLSFLLQRQSWSQTFASCRVRVIFLKS